MLADALGRPLRFIITPGQNGDITQAEALIVGSAGRYVIADRAYDSRALREAIEATGAAAVIPPNPARKYPHSYDPTLYRVRNRIERCFNKLKHFRRFATRFDRRSVHFLAFIHIASAMIWMR
jgi:transposase